MSRLKKMTTFKDERDSYIVATATFSGCGECSVVYGDKAYGSCFSEEALKAAGVMLKPMHVKQRKGE